MFSLVVGLMLLLTVAASFAVVANVKLSATGVQLERIRTALVAKHFAPNAEWCRKYGHGGTRIGEQLCLEKMLSVAEEEVSLIAKGKI